MQACYFPHEVRLLRELKASGFEPAVVYDIGASTGVWSETIAGVFPQAEYHLFEPLAELVDAYKTDMAERLRRLPNLKLHPFALGDSNGSTEIFVSREDPYASSVHFRPSSPAPMQVTRYRLDDYVAEKGLPAPDIIKMDCQGAEDTILNGGKGALQHAKVLFLETWLRRDYGPKTPLLCEIIEFLKGFSFSPVEIGERFYDDRHRLYSIDVAFFSESLLQQTDPLQRERVHEASSSKSVRCLPEPNAPQEMTVSELAQKLLAITASPGGDLALSAPLGGLIGRGLCRGMRMRSSLTSRLIECTGSARSCGPFFWGRPTSFRSDPRINTMANTSSLMRGSSFPMRLPPGTRCFPGSSTRWEEAPCGGCSAFLTCPMTCAPPWRSKRSSASPCVPTWPTIRTYASMVSLTI